jgi:hypothetical protein
MRHLAAFFLVASWVAACGASGSSNSGFSPCAAGDACADASASAPAPDITRDASAGCGDGFCAAPESCTTCPADCGVCPKCDFAPSCEGAAGAPASPLPRPDLSQPAPDGGAPDTDAGVGDGKGVRCGDPQLRVRIEKIHVYNGGGTLYCIVDANDGVSSEVAITPKTADLGDDKEHFFQEAEATYWGLKGLHATKSNLLVTYNCYRVKNDAWSDALKAAGDTAAQIGGQSVGPYGWAFGVGGVAANAAAAAIAAANKNDDLELNAQQVIAKEDLLDLTNGRTWTVRKGDGGGVFGIGKWDWEITLEAWGCADGIPVAR